MRFSTASYFHHSNQRGPLINWFTYIFSILVKISPSYSNFSVEKTDSPGYGTPGSQIFGLNIRITQQILNQNRKYFNALVSGTGRFQL